MSAKERAGDTVGIVRRFPNAYEVRRMPVGLERLEGGERMALLKWTCFAVGLLIAELGMMALMVAR